MVRTCLSGDNERMLWVRHTGADVTDCKAKHDFWVENDQAPEQLAFPLLSNYMDKIMTEPAQ